MQENVLELKCKYGCGQEAKYLNKFNEPICDMSPNRCPTNRAKNSIGLKQMYKDSKRSQQEIYLNMKDSSKEKMQWNKGNIKADFKYDGKGKHRKLLILERGNTCQMCNLSSWQNKPIVLELDHINGDRRDNDINNLRLLCPNCHSTTENWRGRNINSGKVKVSDEALLDSLHRNKNIYKSLIDVGLTPKGGNYLRCRKLLEKYQNN